MILRQNGANILTCLSWPLSFTLIYIYCKLSFIWSGNTVSNNRGSYSVTIYQHKPFEIHIMHQSPTHSLTDTNTLCRKSLIAPLLIWLGRCHSMEIRWNCLLLTIYGSYSYVLNAIEPKGFRWSSLFYGKKNTHLCHTVQKSVIKIGLHIRENYVSAIVSWLFTLISIFCIL